jgi:hypothetical protein
MVSTLCFTGVTDSTNKLSGPGTSRHFAVLAATRKST